MSEVAKYQNVFRSILVSGVITFTAYLITSIISFIVGFPFLPGYFLVADIQFLIGTVFGVIYFIKKRRPDQSILLYCVIVGIVGGILAALFISIYQWVLFLNIYMFVIYFIPCLISGVFIGFLIGVIISVYNMYKEVKEERPEKHYDDDFFKELIEE
ncbi:MAG: hypothetical protein ACFFA4_04335 [Promethearchaeota archaeon]